MSTLVSHNNLLLKAMFCLEKKNFAFILYFLANIYAIYCEYDLYKIFIFLYFNIIYCFFILIKYKLYIFNFKLIICLYIIFIICFIYNKD